MTRAHAHAHAVTVSVTILPANAPEYPPVVVAPPRAEVPQRRRVYLPGLAVWVASFAVWVLLGWWLL